MTPSRPSSGLTEPLTVMAGWIHHEGTSTEDRDQWLPAMFAAASVGMAVVDEQGCWVTVNPPLCRMLGYERTELVGHSFVELTHPDDLLVSQRALERLRRGEMDTFEFEKRYVVRNGEIVWVLINGSTFSAPGDERRLYLVETHDLTRRKLVEEELQGERRLLNAFLRHAPYFVCFRDRAGRFLGMSDALAAELGFASAEEAIGKTNFDVFPTAQASALHDEEQRTMASGRAVVDREELITRRNGEGLWLSRSVAPLRDGPGGAVVGTVTISIDVTTRKLADARLRESEQRWRSLLAHVEEMVVMIDTSGRIEYASPVVERWLGYPADKLVGLDVTFPSHPDQTAELRHALEDARSGQPVTLIGKVQAADGTWRSVESRIVRFDDSNDASLLLISRDITERLELDQERERLEMDRRVSQRLEAVGQLSAGIAHEINTPLQYVGDSVTFLRDAVDDLLILTGLYREGLFNETPIPLEERRRTMTLAEDEADVEYLVDSLPKAFARTEEGIGRVRTIVQAMKRFSYASSTEVGPADLNDALRTTLAVCRNEYKYVAEVTTDLADIPLVACNIGEINQVFLNLVINAAQAIDEAFDDGAEPGHISISTRTDGDEVVVEIEDDGPGIPREIRERIYEPFFTTKEVGKGTGQGLALARTTIEHHHGSLSCASEVGVGTKFTIRLPIDQAIPDATPTPTPTPTTPTPTPTPTPAMSAVASELSTASLRPRILCVDDEPHVLDGLRGVLRRSFDVRVATSGATGLSMLRDEPDAYAIVISDMRMPEMSGASFLRQARAVAPDAVRILLTGHADLEVAIKAVNGARLFRYLTKPTDAGELLRTCAAALGHHRQHAAEQVVLEQTVRDSVDTLSDVLALANPVVFGRASRIKVLAARLGRALGLANAWEVEVAAMLSQIGAITLPQATAEKLYAGLPVEDAEAAMVARVPDVTRRLIGNIPRLDGVLDILDRSYGDISLPASDPAAAGAQILRIVRDYDSLECQGAARRVAIGTLRGRGIYDDHVVDVLARVVDVGGAAPEVREVALDGLELGTVLADDALTLNGSLLAARGQPISDELLERLRNIGPHAVRQPLHVVAGPARGERG